MINLFWEIFHLFKIQAEILIIYLNDISSNVENKNLSKKVFLSQDTLSYDHMIFILKD
jgi:hypothetical protein